MHLDTELTTERRLFERFPSRFPAKFKDARDDFGSTVQLKDASAQGIKITTKEKCYLNDSIALEVNLPDGLNPMNISGEVVWRKQVHDDFWNVGLRLHKVQLMKMSRLYKFALPDAT